TSLRWNVAPPSGLETLIQQTSPVASDRLWVVASHLHHYITVSNGKLRGERAQSRPDRPTPGSIHQRPEGRRASGGYWLRGPRRLPPEIPVSLRHGTPDGSALRIYGPGRRAADGATRQALCASQRCPGRRPPATVAACQTGRRAWRSG